MGAKRTYAEIKKYIESNTPSRLLSEDYIGTYEPLLLRCSCGAEFSASWHQIRSQNRTVCVACAIKRRAGLRRRSIEDIKKRISDAGYEYISGDYENPKSKVVIRCSCGHTKTIAYSNIFYNGFSGLCDECSKPLNHGSNRLSIEDVRELSALRGIILLSDTYTNARSKLRFLCKCGREFEATWDSVVSHGKTRCDYCSNAVSSGELAIQTWLDEHSIKYEREKSFPGFVGRAGKLYKYDFYIPSKNLCIEYDGQQHSKTVNYSGKMDEATLKDRLMTVAFNDYIKTQYCENHGIGLLRIDYSERNKLPEILTGTLIPR